MKIELIKEVSFLGEVSYYLEIDGKYIVGSMTSKEEKANEFYEFVQNNKSLKTKDVIKQTEI
jgi:hypothetical protein